VQSFTVLDLFKYESLKSTVWIFTVLDCILNFQFMAPTLMLDQFGFSIFLSGAVVESAQLVSGIMSYFMIYRY
jgi:hypothetical protein